MVLIRLASHGKEVDCDKEGRRGGGVPKKDVSGLIVSLN